VCAGARSYTIFLVPPSQDPTTLRSPTWSLATISSVYPDTCFASSFAAISVLSSSQGLAASAAVDATDNAR